MTQIKRITALMNRLGAIGTAIAADPTQDQPKVESQLLEDNRRLLETTYDLIDSGVTYERWRKHFIQANRNTFIAECDTTGEYIKICNELANMDMRELFEQHILPGFEGGRDCAVVHQLQALIQMLESLKDV